MKHVIALLSFSAAAWAGPLASANYDIPVSVADSGGRRSTSSTYRNDGSLGAASGISAVATTVAKHGYVGQLYDFTSLLVGASPSTVNEAATRQLTVTAIADDLTSTALAPAGLTWTILSGPVNSISAEGLVTAGIVAQNTDATVRGTFGPFTSDLSLTVLDSIPDNYGSYAGDGLLDAWQLQYFGAENPLAAPGLDPDGDGQTNLFEFTAGLSPIDPASRFTMRLEKVPGQPAQKRVVFSPRLNDRLYSVKAKSSLAAGPWVQLPSIIESDNGDERTVTDLDAATPNKFYQVEITKP